MKTLFAKLETAVGKAALWTLLFPWWPFIAYAFVLQMLINFGVYTPAA
jgi:hypothetical protein